MVRYDWLSVSGLVFRPENPPPSRKTWLEMSSGDAMTTYSLSTCPRGQDGQAIPESGNFWALTSSVLFCKATKWSILPGLDWHWLLLISAHGKRESSPLFITFHYHSSTSRNLTTLSTLKEAQAWKVPGWDFYTNQTYMDHRWTRI